MEVEGAATGHEMARKGNSGLIAPTVGRNLLLASAASHGGHGLDQLDRRQSLDDQRTSGSLVDSVLPAWRMVLRAVDTFASFDGVLEVLWQAWLVGGSSSGPSFGLSILCSAQHHQRLCCSRHRGSVLHGAHDFLHLVLLDREDGGGQRLSPSANQDRDGHLNLGHLAM
eukprot:s1074_g8.t1